MKNKTPKRNTGFRNSLYLGIFVIVILAATVSMIAVNVYRYFDPYGPKLETGKEEIYSRDTIYITSPPEKIVVHDTVWRTRPANKIKVQEVNDSL